MTEDEIHIRARAEVLRRKASGVQFDKKQLRFNDIVFTALRYGETPALRKAGMNEAIDACVIGDPMHVPGGSVCDIVDSWMLTS